MLTDFYYRITRGAYGNHRRFQRRGIAESKTGNNGMKMIFFEIGSESCVGSYFKFNRNKDCPEHVRRKPWFKVKD